MDVPVVSSSTLASSRAKTVQSQVLFYKSLLALRIRLQPFLCASYRFPPPALLPGFVKCSSQIKSLQKQAARLLLRLYHLRSSAHRTLKKQSKTERTPVSPEVASTATTVVPSEKTDTLPSSNREGEDVSTAFTGDGDDSYFALDVPNNTSVEKWLWESLDAQWEPIKKRCLDNADDWKARTQLKRHQGLQVLDQPPSSQFRKALLDYNRLLERSRPHLEKQTIIGLNEMAKKHIDEGIQQAQFHYVLQNSYSDQDFYTQLLKDAISSYGESTSSHLIKSLHHTLKTNGKEKAVIPLVKRHTSKGRKLRYHVIPKLENFMSAAVSGSGGTAIKGNTQLLDEALVNQLMLSLFSDK